MSNRYSLISKTTNIPFKNYRKHFVSIALPKKGGHFADKINIFVDKIDVFDKKLDYKNTVTTYKDKDGNIIGKIFDFANRDLICRIYNHIFYKNIIGIEKIKSKEIREYRLPRKLLKHFCKKQKNRKYGLWNLEKIETHHVSENSYIKDKIHSLTRILNLRDKQTSTHTIIEFPHTKRNILGFKMGKTNKKLLQFDVDKNNWKVIEGSQITQNVEFPQKDPYLPYRILGLNDFIIPITKLMIKKRGLSDMKIGIGYYNETLKNGKKTSAHFKPWAGKIEYNIAHKRQSKIEITNTSRHETEHAWQYYLDSRSGTPHGNWGKMIQKKFGDLSQEPELKKVADAYKKSIANYVSYEENEIEYFKSLIERLAREAGENESKIYEASGYEIRSDFPHIPYEVL